MPSNSLWRLGGVSPKSLKLLRMLGRFFFKPTFFMGKRARGSEVPHCSGDFYQTFGCQVQKLKTEETAIKVSCMRCLGW